MDKHAKAELVKAIHQRYVQARKKDKSKILDEFVAITPMQLQRLYFSVCKTSNQANTVTVN